MKQHGQPINPTQRLPKRVTQLTFWLAAPGRAVTQLEQPLQTLQNVEAVVKFNNPMQRLATQQAGRSSHACCILPHA